MVFIPFKQIGDFKFGVSETELTEKEALKSAGSPGVNGKMIYQKNNLVFRFDKGVLTQVHIVDPDFPVFYNNLDLSRPDNIRNFIKENTGIESRAHFIFPEAGLAIGKDLKEIDLFFFDEELLKFWKNIHRPITSW